MRCPRFCHEGCKIQSGWLQPRRVIQKRVLEKIINAYVQHNHQYLQRVESAIIPPGYWFAPQS